jgi:hypothetical protein
MILASFVTFRDEYPREISIDCILIIEEKIMRHQS